MRGTDTDERPPASNLIQGEERPATARSLGRGFASTRRNPANTVTTIEQSLRHRGTHGAGMQDSDVSSHCHTYRATFDSSAVARDHQAGPHKQSLDLEHDAAQPASAMTSGCKINWAADLANKRDASPYPYGQYSFLPLRPPANYALAYPVPKSPWRNQPAPTNDITHIR